MTAAVPHLTREALASLPAHIAVIMDGNGRWAKQRHLPRVEGHRNGVESVRTIVRAAGEAGIKYLTLYAFSVENWNRPKDEVDTLMRYLARYLKGEIGELNRSNVRLEAIGQIYRLTPPTAGATTMGTATLVQSKAGLDWEHFAITGGNVYFADGSRLYKAPIAGGTPTVVLATHGISYITTDATSIYLAGSCGVQKAPL